jgi:hypothetical protein
MIKYVHGWLQFELQKLEIHWIYLKQHPKEKITTEILNHK